MQNMPDNVVTCILLNNIKHKLDRFMHKKGLIYTFKGFLLGIKSC